MPHAAAQVTARIDRRALVQRHNPTARTVDPSSPLMVGNGNLAFTADITGLQTHQEMYTKNVPLMIQAQWAWHSFPNSGGYRLDQNQARVETPRGVESFPWLRDWSEASRPAVAWLRENPHRFSLGRLAFASSAGPLPFSEVVAPEQTLDLWTGTILSRFVWKGLPVSVETSVHPTLDAIVVRIESEHLSDGTLGVLLSFPGVSVRLNPDPADWGADARHTTRVVRLGDSTLSLLRQLDETRYSVAVRADEPLAVTRVGRHSWRLAPRRGTRLTLVVDFSPKTTPPSLPLASVGLSAAAQGWESYWQTGGMIDLAGSTDPRAPELERRIVLSQYLMAVNAAGQLPPQEDGLFSNSWNGKFHLEMHPWHAAHFATWGRPALLERSMHWYVEHLPEAQRRAASHGLRGAWWPKMVGPEGRESPSTVNPFILWQQPHPIFLAELLYRADPRATTLDRYRSLVFESANLLASLLSSNRREGRYALGPPVMPAQETFPPLETFNPAFELAYFRQGLGTAQEWRKRLGLAPNPNWEQALSGMPDLPERDGLYLAAESQPLLWEQARSPQCAPPNTGAACPNRDHPSFVAALGLLRGAMVDPRKMSATMTAVRERWDFRQTWGWDFPLLAMTAARLGQPLSAIEWLMTPAANFQFGRAGMTPRHHLVAPPLAGVPAERASPAPELERVSETYFPSNGALLLAVGMMAAGWDGAPRMHPGFPADGSWSVRTEGILPLP